VAFVAFASSSGVEALWMCCILPSSASSPDKIAHLWITRAWLAVAALDVADYFEEEPDAPLDFVEPFSRGLAVTTSRYSLHRLCISPVGSRPG